MPLRRKATALAKPPRQFPVVIKPHAFDGVPSLSDRCLICGQKKDHRLHIQPHVYSRNYSSKLFRCICGLNHKHPLHIERKKNEN